VVLVHRRDWPSRPIVLGSNKSIKEIGEHDMIHAILAEFTAEFPIEVETFAQIDTSIEAE
jgi:hypothetical protein